MLQTLSDFFLLISTDKNTITSKDLSIFYNFITKKMPQIQQQNPSLISDLLLEDNDKIENINLRDYSKKHFLEFQKQIMNLIINLIDYCYEKQIIKLSTHCEELIKEKIKEKINNNSKFDKILKEEKRKFIIFLIINEGINFNISPHHFINFFNSENKNNIRTNIEIFVKFIKSLTKFYSIDKKQTKVQKRRVKKSKTHIMKDITDIKNIKKNNKKYETETTNKSNKSNNSSKKSQLTNSLAKKNNSSINGQQKILSAVDINDSGNLRKSKFSKKDSENLKNINKKLDFNQKNETNEDEVNDTFLCDTPNNISSCEKKNSDEDNLRKNMSQIRQSPKHFSKEITSPISYNKFRNSKTISTNIATEAISYSEQKENQIDFSKKLKKIKEVIDNEKYYTVKNKNINKSISEKITTNDLKNEKINSEKKNNYLKGYNVIRTTGVNEKNENYKESYVYKNYEMHEHLVIFDDNDAKKKDYIEDDEIVGCNAF